MRHEPLCEDLVLTWTHHHQTNRGEPVHGSHIETSVYSCWNSWGQQNPIKVQLRILPDELWNWQRAFETKRNEAQDTDKNMRPPEY